jgi:hypothetical protein
MFTSGTRMPAQAVKNACGRVNTMRSNISTCPGPRVQPANTGLVCQKHPAMRIWLAAGQYYLYAWGKTVIDLHSPIPEHQISISLLIRAVPYIDGYDARNFIAFDRLYAHRDTVLVSPVAERICN